MIIDSHVHVGFFDGGDRTVDMTEELVLQSMKKYRIDYALISVLECVCFDVYQKYIEKKNRKTQTETNLRAIEFAKQNPDRIGVIYIMEPYESKCDEEYEKIYLENKEYIHGLKFHPYHMGLAIDDKRCESYIEFAGKYDLPIIIHTASDENSHIKHLVNAAKKYKDVNFIAAHMGLGTDNEQTIQAIKDYPNIYGDTAWVQPDRALDAIRLCGEDKILFGTDNPIDGLDTYADKNVCSVYLNEFKDRVSEEIYKKFMCDNACRLFKLDFVKC